MQYLCPGSQHCLNIHETQSMEQWSELNRTATFSKFWTLTCLCYPGLGWEEVWVAYTCYSEIPEGKTKYVTNPLPGYNWLNGKENKCYALHSETSWTLSQCTFSFQPLRKIDLSNKDLCGNLTMIHFYNLWKYSDSEFNYTIVVTLYILTEILLLSIASHN